MCRRAAFEFGFDGFGQLFAVFHAPLVEGVGVPHGGLDEDAMFVEGDEHAEGEGVEAFGQQGVAGAVALKAAVRLTAAFARHQGFSLGEGVGGGEGAVFLRVGGVGGDDEVDGNQARALVQQLEIGVLAVDAFAAPDDAAGVATGGAAV